LWICGCGNDPEFKYSGSAEHSLEVFGVVEPAFEGAIVIKGSDDIVNLNGPVGELCPELLKGFSAVRGLWRQVEASVNLVFAEVELVDLSFGIGVLDVLAVFRVGYLLDGLRPLGVRFDVSGEEVDIVICVGDLFFQ
jgi:hypothetical protein